MGEFRTSFRFRAIGPSGRMETGVVDARDEAEAMKQLAGRGLNALELVPGRETAKSSARPAILPLKVRARFVADIAALMDARLSVDEALHVIQQGTSSEILQARIGAALHALRDGASLGDALAHAGVLAPREILLIASGDVANNLQPVLAALSQDMARAEKSRKEILNALSYPAFLIIMMLLALGAITFVLVPSLQPVFDGSGRQPPAIISAFAWLRDFLASNLPGLAALATLTVLLMVYGPARQATISGLGAAVPAIPFVGPVVTGFDRASYLRTLGHLLESGMPTQVALNRAAAIVISARHRPRLSDVSKNVSDGMPMPEALSLSDFLDKGSLAMIAAGDASNQNGKMAINAASIVEADAVSRLNRLVDLVTPVTTILMGGLIGFLVVSVMNALLSINEFAF